MPDSPPAGANKRMSLRWLISILRLALVLPGCTPPATLGAVQAPELQADSARIALDGPAGAMPHTVTLEDIAALRDVDEPMLSPDGQRIAFLVRQGFRDCNCYRTAVYVASADGRHAPTKLVEEGLLSNLRWTPDAGFVTYLSSRGGSRQVWRVSMAGGSPELVFTHSAGARQAYREEALGPRDTSRIGVDEYEWSPDGTQLAFVTRPATDSAAVQRVSDGGLVYDDDRMHVRDIQLGQWTHEPAELWLYDVGRHRERLVWRAPRDGARSASYVGIQGLAWSPSANGLAISYSSGISTGNGLPTFDLGVVDLARNTVRTLAGTDSMYEWKPVWSSDGRHVAFASVYSGLSETGSRSALGVADVATGEVHYLGRGRIGPMLERLWWVDRGTALAFEASSPAGPTHPRAGIYRLELRSGDIRRVTAPAEHMSACGQIVRSRVACIRQNSNLAPEPVLVDLDSASMQTVATVNPELRSVTLMPVSELRWTNKYGTPTNGYLIRPQDYVRGQRYPLLIILYGFQGRFVTAAEWIPSYPAQSLAQQGFAVLLWNYPRWETWSGNDYARGSAAMAYGPLASLESAVTLLARQGLADTSRVGLLGWSYGGFLAEFALTHSSRFQVASVGNDGDFNPGAYWALGWRAYRLLMERVLGGPPYGRTLRNWEALSPALNARRVQVPVLMESSAEEAPLGLEMFGALRQHGAPVEFVIYPNEGHILTQPVHRFASMRRNLDWFSFWLLGREDTDPSKREQYERWRNLRSRLAQIRHSPNERASSRRDRTGRTIPASSAP